MAVAQGHAVAGQAVGVGRDSEHPTEAACGKQDRLGPEGVELAVGEATGHDAGRSAAGRGLAPLEDQIHDLELVEELHAVLDALLVERLQDHVAGPVGRKAGPPDGRLTVVAGVPAETPLVDLALRRAVERQAHVLELYHGLDRFTGQHLGGVLVDQVVPALDRVEHVPLPVVLLEVAESGADTALGRSRMGAGWIELRQNGRVDALTGEFERSPQARSAGADNKGIERVVHGLGRRHSDKDDDRAHREEHHPDQIEGGESQSAATALQVVHGHRPHAEEGVQENHHQEKPIEAAPEEAVPALVEDPGAVLLRWIEEEVLQTEVRKSQNAQGNA